MLFTKIGCAVNATGKDDEFISKNISKGWVWSEKLFWSTCKGTNIWINGIIPYPNTNDDVIRNTIYDVVILRNNLFN